MTAIKNSAIAEVFDNYPKAVRPKLEQLRQLILEAADEAEGVDRVEETLKWGEPSYLTKDGSTIRLGWKSAAPKRYGLYFICTTTLVETFRYLFDDKLTFDGNRAILFELSDEIPVQEIKQCIKLAMTYHRIKHLPFLGM